MEDRGDLESRVISRRPLSKRKASNSGSVVICDREPGTKLTYKMGLIIIY